MAISKTNERPTVKQVIFQIQFPNLFFIENKIPDIQIDVIGMFPNSTLIVKSPISISIGDSLAIQKEPENERVAQKIWEFKNENGYQLNLSSSHIFITSMLHNFYNNDGDDHKFRDVIEFVLETVGKHIRFPIISRVGLRYIYECPFSLKTADNYADYFNTAFNLENNPIDRVNEMHLYLDKDVEDCKVSYQECYIPQTAAEVVVLSFDGYKQNIVFCDCLATADRLHAIISNEYEKAIKKPVYDSIERAQP